MSSIISSNHKLAKGKRRNWWLGKSSPRQIGETSTGAKLTEVDVYAIRARARSGETITKISADYPVTRIAISNIISGRAWKHLPEQP